MSNVTRRLDKLEDGLRRDWRYLATLPVEALTSAELDSVVSHVDPAVRLAFDGMLDELSTDELQALADADVSGLTEEQQALIVRFEQAYQALGHVQRDPAA